MKKYHMFGSYDYEGTDFLGSFETLEMAAKHALERSHDIVNIMMIGKDGGLIYTHSLDAFYNEDGNRCGVFRLTPIVEGK